MLDVTVKCDGSPSCRRAILSRSSSCSMRSPCGRIREPPDAATGTETAGQRDKDGEHQDDSHRSLSGICPQGLRVEEVSGCPGDAPGG